MSKNRVDEVIDAVVQEVEESQANVNTTNVEASIPGMVNMWLTEEEAAKVMAERMGQVEEAPSKFKKITGSKGFKIGAAIALGVAGGAAGYAIVKGKGKSEPQYVDVVPQRQALPDNTYYNSYPTTEEQTQTEESKEQYPDF